MSMEKISSQQVKTLLKTASATIRDLETENADLRVKLASKEKRERAEKLASMMDEKGLSAEFDHQEKVAHLLEAPDLNVTEEAIKMASPQTGGIGNIGDRPGAGLHAFETYIISGESGE